MKFWDSSVIIPLQINTWGHLQNSNNYILPLLSAQYLPRYCLLVSKIKEPQSKLSNREVQSARG
jgi:hypothetical protein